MAKCVPSLPSFKSEFTASVPLTRIRDIAHRNDIPRDLKQIAEVVSHWTGIPVTRLGQNEKERLIGLAGRLHERIVGQDGAVQAVAGLERS
jgi:ATP-dependent Clp protease ATP-binding subunit ClpA